MRANERRATEVYWNRWKSRSTSGSAVVSTGGRATQFAFDFQTVELCECRCASLLVPVVVRILGCNLLFLLPSCALVLASSDDGIW